MVFNDTTNKNGAIQECEEWLFGNNYGAISSNSTLLSVFTKNINYGLDQTVIEILKADGRWQYDDPNYTDIPIATTNLVDSVATYQLDRSHLKIEGVEIKQPNGQNYTIQPIDYRDWRQKQIAEGLMQLPAGMPSWYDLRGDTIVLFPAPSAAAVTLTAGITLYYQREGSYFESTDTTKEMGVPRMFQDIPVLFAVSRYAKKNMMIDKSNAVDAELARRIADIKGHFNKRDKDEKKQVRARYRSPM